MFKSSLFHSIPCPEKNTCRRSPCLFSHETPVVAPSSFSGQTKPLLADERTSPKLDSAGPSTAPKRSASITPPGFSPPRKLLKVSDAEGAKATVMPRKAPTKRAVNPLLAAVNSGPPILRISAGASKIPVTERQKMATKLYEAFLALYQPLGPKGGTLATEHSLAQEIEIYERTNSKTYKNATINVLVSLKKRPPPNAPFHPSVGTESQVHARAAAAKQYGALTLIPEDLSSALLTLDEMREYGFVVEVPDDWGPGGDRVSEVGNIITCDRCANDYTCMAAFGEEECQFHWGRALSNKVAGKKVRAYTCCHQEYPSEGCSKGPHVFYDTDRKVLHSRHPFSRIPPPTPNSPTPGDPAAPHTHLAVVAIDCEMIYTTAGMSVARVSIVDQIGETVFDELVKPDDGVMVVDFNTRFSGVQSLDAAKMDLDGVREALSRIIGSDTIVIGHALDNDLNTLRMIHHQVVDTVKLFPHPAGPPRKRALRDISSEILDRRIQVGSESSGEGPPGAVGHSSVEDARATLDLVRWWVCERRNSMSSK
ncbi:RNA exonuclease 3 [Tulasnella sp. JGI-2019a]|nr:RNA exonuclease 3 [Tulasnella sp. JGI-2019a]